jgi:hypothetical protein
VAEKTLSVLEIAAELKRESKISSRYPVRVVFTNSFTNYVQLVKHLQENADQSLLLSKFCGGNDTIPDLDAMIAEVKNLPEQTILITAFGEYFRMAIKSEKCLPKFHSLFNTESNSKKRIWIPLFCAKEYFDDLMGALNERQFGNVFFIQDENDISSFSVNVFSPDFAVSEKTETTSNGLKDWLENWETIKIKSGHTLITKRHSLFDNTIGLYEITKVISPYQYIKSKIADFDKVNELLGTATQWQKLAKYLKDTVKTIRQLILTALNILEFDPYDILNKWDTLDADGSFGKWLFWLWYQLDGSVGTDYVSYAVSKSKSFVETTKNIELGITSFSGNLSDKEQWIEERRKALKLLRITISKDFWIEFNKIEDDRQKLKILSANTFAEKVKIIEVISHMLKSGKTYTDFNIILKEKYLDLCFYLNNSIDCVDSDLQDYFSYYRRLKIQDDFESEIEYFRQKCDIHSIKARGNELNKIAASRDAFYLWIDGMGIEWVGMLINKIKTIDASIECHADVAQANVPTTTEANKVWDKMDLPYFKYDKLDSQSHIKDKSDISSYFEVVARQFDIISEIAKKAVELLDSEGKDTLIITADHGLSRLAAKAFHALSGYDTPTKGAKVENLGRYCILEDNKIVNVPKTYREDNFLMFQSHDHFICSGNAPGEIHGGVTPEEFLVPIITVSRNKKNEPVKIEQIGYKLTTCDIKLNAEGEAVFDVELEKSIHSLEASVGSQRGICTKINDTLWQVKFGALLPGKKYLLSVLPNRLYNSILNEVTVERRGMIVDDDF